jgi:purine nucleosidase
MKEKWIIDTDPGIDDMAAILYLISRPNVDILMISTVDGNVSQDLVSNNCRKILKLVGKNIPIYRGSSNPIIKSISNDESYHYSDGLGDIDEIKSFEANEIQIEKENSIIKLIEYAERFPNEINLLLLGPLTTIASAYTINPRISTLFKKIYLMGASIFSRGNVIPTSEFNFYYDYIAAKIVISNFKNIIITPWEPTEKIYYMDSEMEKIYKLLNSGEKNYNQQIFNFMNLIVKKFTIEKKGINFCDLYSIIPAFNTKCVRKFSMSKIDIIIDSHMNGTSVVIERKIISSDFNNYVSDELEKNHINGYHLIIEDMDKEMIEEEYISIF